MFLSLRTLAEALSLHLRECTVRAIAGVVEEPNHGDAARLAGKHSLEIQRDVKSNGTRCPAGAAVAAESSGESERYTAGREVFVRIWGEEAISRFEGNVEALSPDLLRFVMEFVAAEVWARDGIDPKTRSLITIAVLGTLGRTRQLAEHVEGALNNGATEAEIVETLLHLSPYAGVPAAWDSLDTARRVFRTRHRRPGKQKAEEGE